MKSSSGFVWLPVLLAVLAVLAVSGGAWWYVQQREFPAVQETLAPIDSLTFTYDGITFQLQQSAEMGYAYRAKDAVYNFMNTSVAGPLDLRGTLGGVDTQIVILWRSSGANIIEPILFAFQKSGEAWRQIAVTKLPYDGGRTSFEAMTIENDTIVMDVKTSGPDRNYHDTYVPKRYVYALQNGALVLQKSTTTTDETAGWKTYTNTEYGFSLSYPPNWNMLNYPEAGISMGVAFQADDLSGFNATASRVPNGQTLKQVLQIGDEQSKSAYEGTPSKSIISSKEVSLGGLVGIQRKEIWYAAGFATMVTYAVKNNTLYTFRLSVSREGTYTDKDLETYNQILSTVKFAN